MTSSRLLDIARDARWLTRERIVMGGQLLLLVQATVLLLLALWQHGVILGGGSDTASDFVSFYAAGKLALAGTPASAYDQAAHFAMEQRFTVAGAQYQYFFYPPVFLLLFAPLALLPYHVAFYVFECATLLGFLLVMRRILDARGWAWLAPVLAFPAIFWTLGLGQNAFLTASLFGLFTLLIDRRPGLAGLCLGLLCYKPHFGLLAPVALIFGRHWRAFLAAAATVAGLVALSAALFGIETWRAYLTAFAGSNAVYATGRIDYAGIVTPFGAARLLGFSPASAYAAQAAMTGLMALLTGLAWRSGGPRDARGGVLLSATLLAVPLALLYDRMLLLVAIGWLARGASREGFLPWEKIILLAVWLGSIADYAVGSAWGVPLGPAISLAVLALALRRAARSTAPARRPVQMAAPAE